MKKPYKSILFGLLQVGILLSIAGKYTVDRYTCPRAWVKTASFDPKLPIRGRYVTLRPVLPLKGSDKFQLTEEEAKSYLSQIHLHVHVKQEDDQLVAFIKKPEDSALTWTQDSRHDPLNPPENAILDKSELEKPENERVVTLLESVPFFIPEDVPDPSIRAEGEELWMEVTIPKKGPLRPIRLAVKKGDDFSVLY